LLRKAVSEALRPQLLGVDDRHGAAVIARHVVADPDRGELERRALEALAIEEYRLGF